MNKPKRPEGKLIVETISLKTAIILISLLGFIGICLIILARYI